MRVLFIGSVEFSAQALLELIRMKVQIVGVCTLADSCINADHVDLRPIAEMNGIPTIYTPNINSTESFGWIHDCQPDVIFCFGWSKLLKAPLLALPRLGVVGYHPAALPANRGRHPLIWALALGLTQTASTFFFMDEDADSGDILSQVNVSISPADDASVLYQNIISVALEQIRDFVPRLADGRFERFPQQKALANAWRKRGVSDGCIDWRMAAHSIHNLVRALSQPYVGAHFNYQSSEIKVWRTSLGPNGFDNIEPGKILAVEDSGVLVKAGIGSIWLRDLAPKIALSLGEYL